MSAVASVMNASVHNAGRSQMAAGYLTHLGGGAIEVRLAGTAPAERFNPAAVAAMAEDGIDITAAAPTALTPDDVRACDVVITMGCGDTCPVFPATRYLDWQLDDPAGLDVAGVRPIRNDVRARVQALITELTNQPTTEKTPS